MLMMLGVWGLGESAIAADAHDARGVWGLGESAIAADAHDARGVWGLVKAPLQLMLMMLGGFGASGKRPCS